MSSLVRICNAISRGTRERISTSGVLFAALLMWGREGRERMQERKKVGKKDVEERPSASQADK